MPAKRKKERIICQHFEWLIGQRRGVWQADGRSNSQSPGRHSLGTKDYDEARNNLKHLDVIKAVELGLVDAAALQRDDPDALSLDEGMRRYIAHAKRPKLLKGVTPKTVARYQAVFDKAVPFLKRLGLANWNQVKKQHLEDYATWLDGEGYAYRTEFFEVTMLKAAFNYWIRDALLPPTAKINLPMEKPTGTDTYCWLPAEVAGMIGHCRSQPELAWLVPVLIALACTGMRISELVGLIWSDIDWDNNVIKLKDETYSKKKSGRTARSTKNRQSRSFPIHEDLRTELEWLHRRSHGQHVFQDTRRRVLTGDRVRLSLIQKVLEPLAEKFPSGPTELGFKDGRLHSFRHFFCSACANNGVPEQVVMRWLGHQSSAMVRHYYHLHDQESQRQMKRLDFINGTDGMLPPG